MKKVGGQGCAKTGFFLQLLIQEEFLTAPFRRGGNGGAHIVNNKKTVTKTRNKQ